MKEKNNRTILVTGGHFTTAMAVIETLQERGYSHFLWAGHKYTMLKDKEVSAEYQEVGKRDIPFYDIKAGKLYRYPSWLGLLSFIRIPLGFIQSFSLILKTKPDLVLSFGGYIALPIALSAWVLRVPVITHEQTTTVGLSNKIIGLVASKVLIAWKESAKHFKSSKVIYTGNPVRKEIFVSDTPLVEFKSKLPVILILGGNQGSHRINLSIEQALPTLTQYFNIIHQTGSNSIYRDYEHMFQFTRIYPTYKVFKGIWGDDIGRAFHQSAVCLTRSGANTVYELAVLKKPSVLIPLTSTVNNEQYMNAKFLETNDLGIILEESQLSAESILDAINKALTLAPISEDIVRTDSTAMIADIIEGKNRE